MESSRRWLHFFYFLISTPSISLSKTQINKRNHTPFASLLGGVFLGRYDSADTVPSGFDLNTLTIIGIYGFNTSTIWNQNKVANAPSGIEKAAMLYNLAATSGTIAKTQIILETNGNIYYRQVNHRNPAATTPWYKFSGTQLT